MADFEDKPTNGYRQDKRYLEFRMDDMEKSITKIRDEDLKEIKESQKRQEIAFAELKTEFRWRAGIFGVGGAGIVLLGKLAIEKLFGG